MSKKNCLEHKNAEWAHKLLSKMLDGWVMDECGYPLDCYDY